MVEKKDKKIRIVSEVMDVDEFLKNPDKLKRKLEKKGVRFRNDLTNNIKEKVKIINLRVKLDKQEMEENDGFYDRGYECGYSHGKREMDNLIDEAREIEKDYENGLIEADMPFSRCVRLMNKLAEKKKSDEK